MMDTRYSTLNQESAITHNLDNPMAEVAVAGVVAQVEPDTQSEQASFYGQGEVIPALVPPHTPLLVSGHVAPVTSILPVPALMPAPAPPVAPASNIDLDADLNPSPAQPTPMGSFHGIGGIQLADEVSENPAAEVLAGQNVQEPIILLEGGMPNEAALPHAPFVQPFAPVQAMPVVDMGAQPLVPVSDDNPVQQPLLRSLRGFEGIQFEDEGEDEDH